MTMTTARRSLQIRDFSILCLRNLLILALCTLAISQVFVKPVAAQDGLPVTYHGGPIMPGPHDVYFIWYGNWSGNTALDIMPDFIRGLNGSSYFNINTVYCDSTGAVVDNSVNMRGQSFDNYSPIAGDYDGDGKTDIAVYRSGATTFFWVRSSDGVVASRLFGQLGDAPVVGDFDGDKKDDVAVYYYNTSTFSYLPSNGGGCECHPRSAR